MIKEEVVWALKNLGDADRVAVEIERREGYELVVQHVKSSNFFSDQTPVAYLVVERKVEE
jgi:hypothetical protein